MSILYNLFWKWERAWERRLELERVLQPARARQQVSEPGLQRGPELSNTDDVGTFADSQSSLGRLRESARVRL